VEVVVLNDDEMLCPTGGAFSTFSIIKAHLADMLAAAGYFYADDGAVVECIDPVIVAVILNLMIHKGITPF